MGSQNEHKVVDFTWSFYKSGKESCKLGGYLH